MSVTPTEPLSYTATELAFKLDKVFPMLGTILNRNVAAVWTYELLSLKGASCVLSFVHGGYTVFAASKVRLFALEAHKVCVDDHRILLRLAIVRRGFVLQLRVALL